MAQRAIKITLECVAWVWGDLYEASDEEVLAVIAADLEGNVFDNVKVISHETYTE